MYPELLKNCLASSFPPTPGTDAIFAANTFQIILHRKETTLFPSTLSKGKPRAQVYPYPPCDSQLCWEPDESVVCLLYKEQTGKHGTQPINDEVKVGLLSRDISDPFDFPSLSFTFPFPFLFLSHLTVAFWVLFPFLSILSPLFSQLHSSPFFLFCCNSIPFPLSLPLPCLLSWRFMQPDFQSARLHQGKTVLGARAGGKGALSYLVTRLRDSPLLRDDVLWSFLSPE